MKQLILLALLCLPVIYRSYANSPIDNNSFTYKLVLNDDCDDLLEAVEELQKAIDAIEEPEEEGGETVLEKLRTEYESRRTNLIDYETGRGHGVEVQEEHNRLRSKYDAALTAYLEKLNELKTKTERLLQKLKQLKKDCADELSERKLNEIDQLIDDYDHKPAGVKEKIEALEKESVAEELKRLRWPRESLERPKNEKGEVMEKEDDYRKRLRGYKEKYPWLPPEKERRESDDDFEDRKAEWKKMMEGKWRKDYWKKIREKVREHIDQEIEDSKKREEEDRDDDGVPDEEEYFYSFRLGYAQDVFDLPFSDRYYTIEALNDIQTSMYEDPDLFAALFEQLGGEFFFGTFSTAPSFVNHDLSQDVRYGIVLSKDIVSKLEGTIQVQYAKASMQAQLPVTVLATSGPQSILGNYELNKRAVRTQLGINYRFSQRSWQPLAGFWLGTEQQNWRSEARIETLNWLVNENSNTAWSYGLNAALRWQSSTSWYGELRSQWGSFEGDSSYGVGLSVGLQF